MYFKSSQEVRSAMVAEFRRGKTNPDRISLAAGQKAAHSRSPLRVQNRENKAGMSMKTKDKYKKSLSPGMADRAPIISGRSQEGGARLPRKSLGEKTSKLLLFLNVAQFLAARRRRRTFIGSGGLQAYGYSPENHPRSKL